jgi:hypothetical protein
VVPTRLLLEGDDLEALLARVRGEHGPDARIVSAERVRSGGIGGFFAKERYEITVEVADPGRPQGAVPARPARRPNPEPRDHPPKSMPAGLEELAALADRSDGAPGFATALAAAVHATATPASAATPQPPVAGPTPSHGNQPELFASVLADFPALAERASRLGEAPHPAPTVRPIRSNAVTTALPAHEYQPVPDATIQLPAFGLPGGNGAVPKTARPRPPGPVTPETASLVGRLVALGLPMWLAVRVNEPDSYSAILSVMAELPAPPRPPAGKGEVLVVLGDLAGAVSTARSTLSSLRLDPDTLAVAGHNTLGVPASARLSGPGDAARWVGEFRSNGIGPGVLAVEVDLDPRASDWPRSIVAAAGATTIWAVADASRKTADSARWLSSLGRVDALAVRGTIGTADPASVLTLGIPIATVDGRPATPHTWAGLLCERLAESEHANR